MIDVARYSMSLSIPFKKGATGASVKIVKSTRLKTTMSLLHTLMLELRALVDVQRGSASFVSRFVFTPFGAANVVVGLLVLHLVCCRIVV